MTIPEISKCGAYALFIASVIFFCATVRNAVHDSRDFVPVYSGARCLLNGCNPYSTAQLEAQYYAGHGSAAELPPWEDETPVYPPSAFLVLSPFAWFNYPAARLLWLFLNSMLFIAAVVFVIAACGKRERPMAIVLGAFFIGTTSVYLVVGQPTIFSVSLLTIGVLLYLQSRWILIATLLLALSLAVKPQLGVLLVLYLIARGVHRRQALMAAAVAVVALVAGALILTSRPASAHWVTDLRTNAAVSLEKGRVNDPSPANFGALRMVNLQVATSIFLSDPKSSDTATYAIVAALFAVWCYAVSRGKPGVMMTHGFAIGALSLLTLLPVYHRSYDVRLLLLCIPAALLLYRENRRWGIAMIAALVLSVLSFQFRIFLFVQQHPGWQGIMRNKLIYLLLLREQIIMMLALFFLCVAALLVFRRLAATPEAYA